MLNDRNHRLVARGALAACTVLAAGLVVPSPGSAEPGPRIVDVQERVDRLYHEAEVASERFNTGREELTDARAELRTLRAELAAQEARVTRMRDHLGAMVAVQAQSSPLSTAADLLAADDADAFLSGMAAVQTYNEQQAVLVGAYRREAAQLADQRERMSTSVAGIADDVADLQEAKAEVDAKSAEAEALLDRLRAERRERIEARRAAAAEAEAAQAARVAEAEAARVAAAARVSRSATGERPPTTSTAPAPAPAAPAASGSGSVAADFALGQVGDAYVFGAAGPSSWDCSGLTMVAWGAAGVSLPHSAAMQSGMGTPVSIDQLQPGDLVFYYSPVSHVGMYVGNGQLVHAANPSSPVEVVPVDSMPITGMRRIG